MNFLDTLSVSVQNVGRVAKMCEFKIDVGEHKLPKFEYDGDNLELFRSLLAKGIQDKILGKIKNTQEYLERLEEEQDVIETAGFVDYFLILWDMIKWAKGKGIIVGNARGSVAGSLIAFLLDITTVDPIRFDLMFERFLNKTRAYGEDKIEIVLEDGKKFLIPKEQYELEIIEGEDLSDDFIKNNLRQYQL